MAEPIEPDYFALNVASARRFHLEPSGGGEGSFFVAAAGREVCGRDYQIERGGFPSWPQEGSLAWRVLEFVSSGVGEVTLGGQQHPVSVGNYFVYGPSTFHRIVTEPRSPLTKYFVVFAVGEPQPAAIDRHLPTPGSVMRTSAPADVTGLFDELVRTGMRRTDLTRRMLSVQLEHLVLRLAETAIPLDVRISSAFITYRRCRQHIQERWAELSTLEQLARECGVAPGYVCRLFQRFDHQTPYQYLLQQKMNHAADRLVQEGVTIKALAQELGFSDPFHFSRVFKKTMGLAPVRFARACGNRGESPAPVAPSAI